MPNNYISKESINEIRTITNIVEIIGRYVKLEKSGKKYKALCPFHQENTPSFYVDPETGLYYCFGCQQGGDVFSFLMEKEGWNFAEAARFLAGEYGIEISTRNTQVNSLKEELYKINDFVAKYYQKNLFSSAGLKARDYLQERGFSDEIIKYAQLGFALDGWSNLVNTATKNHISLKSLEQLGVIAPRNNVSSHGNTAFYDKMRSRIMFPIRDILGRVIGFGGRILGEGQPKYLNSPETTIYQKSRSLYGLYQARSSIKKTNVAIIMEGYLDVLAAWQAGLTNAVASLGTAFTIEQAQLLKRYTSQCILCYDGDRAGIKATQKGINVLREVGLDVKVVSLPNGLDPDDFIKQYGAKEFREYVDNKSLTAFDFLVSVIASKHDLTNRQDRLRFAKELVSLLVGVENRIEQAGYIASCAERYKIDKKALEHEIERLKRSQKPSLYKNSKNDLSSTQKGEKLLNAVLSQERKLLRLLLNSRNRFESDIFFNKVHQRLYDLITLKKWDHARDLVALCQDVEEKNALASILLIEIGDEKEEQLVSQLAIMKLDNKISFLRNKIRETVSVGDDPSQLLEEFSKLAKKRAHLYKEDDLV